MGVTHYDVLGVPPSADAAAIRAAYRRRAREAHPDAGGSVDEFVAVSAAWRVLSSPAARAEYDEERGGAPGWGEEVDLETQIGVYAPAAPTFPREPPRRTVVAGGDVTSGDLDGAVDPFTSPPRPLPPTYLQMAPWGPPPAMPSGKSLRKGALVFALPAAVALLAAAAIERPDIADIQEAVLFSFLLLAACYARMRMAVSRRPDRWTSAYLLWGAVVSLAITSVAFIAAPSPEGLAYRRVVVGLTYLAGLLAVALLAERHAHRSKRWFAAMDAAVELDQLARTWNALLAARDDSARVATIRRLMSRWPARAQRGWALVDAGGRILAHAPLGAPEAWATLLRARGVKVGEVPRP